MGGRGITPRPKPRGARRDALQEFPGGRGACLYAHYGMRVSFRAARDSRPYLGIECTPVVHLRMHG
jgi:hypothetical protein